MIKLIKLLILMVLYCWPAALIMLSVTSLPQTLGLVALASGMAFYVAYMSLIIGPTSNLIDKDLN